MWLINALQRFAQWLIGDPRMNARGRAEELAERLAHLPTDQWADALEEYARATIEDCRARFFVTYPWWFRYRDLGLDEDAVETLLDLARTNQRDDFLFLAGSYGVPVQERESMWEGTRRRLGLEA
jgi:hypothetical protein